MSNVHTCIRNFAEFRPECDFESGNRMKNTFCKSKKMSFKHIKGNTFVSYVYYRGQQLAQQMEQTNPELVAQLRTQFGRGPPTLDGGDPSQQSKMWFMYGLLYRVLKQYNGEGVKPDKIMIIVIYQLPYCQKRTQLFQVKRGIG